MDGKQGGSGEHVLTNLFTFGQTSCSYPSGTLTYKGWLKLEKTSSNTK